MYVDLRGEPKFWPGISQLQGDSTGTARFTRLGFNPGSKEKGILVLISLASAPTGFLPIVHTAINLTHCQGWNGCMKTDFSERCHLSDFNKLLNGGGKSISLTMCGLSVNVQTHATEQKFQN